MTDDPTPRLPPELLSKIVEYFAGKRIDRASILEFMLASRELYAVGLPVLWRDFELSTSVTESHGFFGHRIRRMLDTGRQIGALRQVRRISVTGGRGWSDEVAEFLSAAAPYLFECVLEGLQSDVAPRLWDLVKDGPNLNSLGINRFFPGLLGPDGALPAQIRRFTCYWLSSYPDYTPEDSIRAIDLSANLVEWHPQTFHAPLKLLEKYPNAANKLRVIEVQSPEVRGLARYAKYCPNLSTLDIVTSDCTEFWSVVACFPLLRELGIMGSAPSRIFEPLIRNHNELALPRHLRLTISMGALDLDPADLDKLGKVFRNLNWRITCLQLMVEPEAGVELAFWEGITRVTR